MIKVRLERRDNIDCHDVRADVLFADIDTAIMFWNRLGEAISHANTAEPIPVVGMDVSPDYPTLAEFLATPDVVPEILATNVDEPSVETWRDRKPLL